MQTYIDKNNALKKEIQQLERNISKIVSSKPKKKPQQKGGRFKTLKGLFSSNQKSKYFEVVDLIHATILQEKYDEADAIIDQNRKILAKQSKAKLKQYDVQDEYGETVLLKAVRSGKTQLTIGLLSRGVGPDISDDTGETPLMVAAKYGLVEIVKNLVKTANRDAKTTFTKKTALHFAAEAGNLEVVEELLSFGSDAKVEDSDGLTPLEVAKDLKVKRALKKHINILDEVDENTGLDELKEDPDLETGERDYSNDEEMKPLLEENEKLKKKKRLLTLQYQDLQKRRLPADTSHELAKLRGLGAEEKKNLLGVSESDELVKEYHRLVLNGDQAGALEEVESFLNQHTKTKKKQTTGILDKDAADEFGETALMKASRLGYIDMVKFLLLYKCNFDLRDMEGQTALMKGAQFGKMDVVQTLIEEGAELDASTRKGKRSALMLAAERGHGGICQLLISEGANYELKDSDGKTAADLALNPEAKEIIESASSDNPLKHQAVQI
eukprot:snap_masked-scaffold_19-processed-gene-6.37-mRNA-1 protein AED:0.19 eAED:0.19 QI:0/-1/0/1/-1/1/1/0/497